LSSTWSAVMAGVGVDVCAVFCRTTVEGAVSDGPLSVVLCAHMQCCAEFELLAQNGSAASR
jgi:hypothetical protein